MKEQKRGGGTLREYRVLHWRITVETYSERTAKLWTVTVFDEVADLRLQADAIHAGLKRIAKDLTAPAPTPLTESDS